MKINKIIDEREKDEKAELSFINTVLQNSLIQINECNEKNFNILKFNHTIEFKDSYLQYNICNNYVEYHYINEYNEWNKIDIYPVVKVKRMV